MSRQESTTEIIPKYFNSNEIERFKRGEHFLLYKKMGAHLVVKNGRKGVYFVVWAPHAEAVSVFGDFNKWKKGHYFLNERLDQSGIWEGFVPRVDQGSLYKFRIHPRSFRWARDKSDPFAFHTQVPPETASRVWPLTYRWHDQEWMNIRKKHHPLEQPLSIYEVHLGSWRMNHDVHQRFLNYRQMAKELIPYVKELGFTHIELLPIMEHPYYGSWGYQSLSYFAPSARYGSPQDFKYFMDACHQNHIGVILDWVPSHFPCDRHGLHKFDGGRLYEMDELHPDWHSAIFNVGKMQVKDFLISSALFWLDQYHVDGIRVDAVASMLYLDYSRGDRWKPNLFGGVENLDSVAFLRELNEAVKAYDPHVMMIAEESTTWQNVSRPVEEGGLNFDMKWNLGWMHDTLSFFCRPIPERNHHLHQLKHCLTYVFYENFLLPLSHDEVVHLKKSILGKMPGDDKEKIQHVKCLYAYMFAHPGKKLLFMGNEIAQKKEWNHEESLSWELLEQQPHLDVQKLVSDLNHMYRREAALYQSDFKEKQFSWVYQTDKKQGIVSFRRMGSLKKDEFLIVLNYKKTYRKFFKLIVPKPAVYQELLSTDDEKYGGRGRLNTKNIKTTARRSKKEYSIELHIPPLSVLFLKRK